MSVSVVVAFQTICSADKEEIQTNLITKTHALFAAAQGAVNDNEKLMLMVCLHEDIGIEIARMKRVI